MQTTAVTLQALAAYFFRLGMIAFGGPPAHIALMRSDLVVRRRWVASEQFDVDLATANLLPGPTSTELAIYIGMRLHGLAGALISGTCFIAPAAGAAAGLAWAYVRYGDVAWMNQLLYGVKPVALALVLHGVVQLVRGTKWNPLLVLIALAAFALLAASRIDVLLIFMLGGVAAAARSLRQHNLFNTALATLTAYANTSAAAPPAAALLWEFIKIGALIYGGGFALVGILQQTFVEHLGWITQRQLLDAIAVGQSTPGPVFTTATFIGYLVAGLPGAIAATFGIFSPAFAFVLLERRLLHQLRNAAWFTFFLQGVGVSALAAIAHASIALGRNALTDLAAVCICAGALAASAWKKIDAHWIVGVGLIISIIRLAVS